MTTALALLDRDGLDALSMRRVAAELDTGAGALYRHVAGKDELLDLVLYRVIGEFRVPPPDPVRWTEQLKEVAHQVRAGMREHRDIVRVSMGRFPMGPNGLRFAEGLLAIMRSGGLPDRTAAVSTHLLTIVINAFSLEDASPIGGPDASPEEANAMIVGYLSSLPVEQFPSAHPGGHRAGDADAHRRVQRPGTLGRRRAGSGTAAMTVRGATGRR